MGEYIPRINGEESAGTAEPEALGGEPELLSLLEVAARFNFDNRRAALRHGSHEAALVALPDQCALWGLAHYDKGRMESPENIAALRRAVGRAEARRIRQIVDIKESEPQASEIF